MLYNKKINILHLFIPVIILFIYAAFFVNSAVVTTTDVVVAAILILIEIYLLLACATNVILKRINSEKEADAKDALVAIVIIIMFAVFSRIIGETLKSISPNFHAFINEFFIQTKSFDILLNIIPFFAGYLIIKSRKQTASNRSDKSSMKIRIKYFEGATKLKKITKGNWIDVYANKDIFVREGVQAMVPLGFALELPEGWEGHLAPRGSTFKSWGVIQTNSVGVVDDTFIGDNDQWHMPVYCLQGRHLENGELSEGVKPEGTWIRRGDKIGQFRVMEVMPEIEFEEVDSFGNTDRGWHGSTGTR